MATKLPKEAKEFFKKTEVLEFFKKTGAEGGKARAKKHTPEELSKWGKKGGRPKKSATKQTKKGGK